MRTLAPSVANGLLAALVAASMLWATSVQALGLGDIDVRSRLNQRFMATIPVLSAAPDDFDSLTVRLASSIEFGQAGIERADYLTSLSFNLVGTGSNALVRLASDQVARDPFLNFIVEARWNGGRFLREYTVLLDPPVETAETGVPGSAAVAEEEPPARRPAQPKAVASPWTARVPATAPIDSGKVDGATGTYGPVQPTQTLWSIAKALRVDSRVSMDQMLLAIYEGNPAAFEGGINSLLAGSLLKVPTTEQALAVDAATATARVAELRGLKPPAVPTAPAPAVAVVPVSPPGASTPPPAVPAPAPTTVPAPAPAAVVEPAAPPVAPEAAAPVAAPEVAPSVTPPVEAPASPVESPAVAAPANTPPPAPAPSAAVAESTPSVAGNSPVDELPWLLVGLLLLIILLLIAVILVRRRKAAAAAAQPTLIRASEAAPWMGASDSDPLLDLVRSKSAPSADDTPTVIAPVVVPDLAKAYERADAPTAASDEGLLAGASVDDVVGEEIERALSTAIDNGDPLTEADFHLAYGLYEEAEQGLKAAIAAEPERNDLKLKLAEVHAAASASRELPPPAPAPVPLLTPIPLPALYDTPEPPPELLAEPPAAASAPIAPISALSVIDFDLDVDPLHDAPVPAAPVTPPAPVVPPPAVVTAPDPAASLQASLNKDLKVDSLADIDLSNFDLEDGSTGDKPPAALSGFTIDELDLDALGDEDGDDLPPMGDEIDTKLDLARAYADMGDDEAANTLLAEVMEGGNKQQRIEAKTLKKRLKS